MIVRLLVPLQVPQVVERSATEVAHVVSPPCMVLGVVEQLLPGVELHGADVALEVVATV